MNVLICGDSFASDWQVKYNDYPGWVNLLAEQYTVTNRAQAGCSEYKIYKQLTQEDLNSYDCILVSHTSPYRIPVEKHPVLNNDVLHNHADLIYADIKDKNLAELNGIIDFFENYFHTEYAEFIHELIVMEQDRYLRSNNTLHLCYYNFKILEKLKDNFCFEHIFKKNPGLINHMSKKGNQQLYQKVNEWIKNVN